MPVRLEGISVVSVQAVVGTQPHKTVVILTDREDPLLKGFAAGGNPDKADVLLVDHRKLNHSLGVTCDREDREQDRRHSSISEPRAQASGSNVHQMNRSAS